MKKKLTVLILGLALSLSITGCTKIISKLPNAIKEATATESTNESDEGLDTTRPGSTDTSENTTTSDPSASKAIYQAFLDGTEKLYTEKCPAKIWNYDLEDFDPFYEDNSGLTFNEFFQYNVKAESGYDSYLVDSINYAYIDLGNDGEPELALETNYSGVYNSINRQYIIKNIDGKLQLVAQLSSGEGYYESLINSYGICEAYGEISADYSVVDGNGDTHFLYNEMSGCDYWMLDDSILNHMEEIDSALNPGESGFFISRYNFTPYPTDYSDETYAEYTANNFYCAEPEHPEYFDEYINLDASKKYVTKLFEAAKFPLYSREEIDAKIAECLQTYHITPDMMEYSEIPWQEMNVDLDTLNNIKETTVSNVSELIDALDQNTKIFLKPGEYDVTEWCVKQIQRGMLPPQYEYDAANDEIIEPTYSENSIQLFYVGNETQPGLVIHGLSNCKIVSEDENNPARIVCTPRDETVLSFHQCQRLTLDNIIIGHTEGNDECSGDVVSFDACNTVHIDRCDLYGCGATGVDILNSYDTYISNSIIHDCSVGCVFANNSYYTRFDNTEFSDVDGYIMFCFWGVSAYFNNCKFHNLNGSFITSDSNNYVTFDSCTFDSDIEDEIKANECFNNGIYINQ